MKTRAYTHTNTVFIVLYIIAIMIGLSLLQSLSTPFSFIEEGIYHLQPYDTKGLIKGGIYLAIYMGALLAIALAFFTRNKLIAYGLIFFIAFSYGIDLLIQLIGNSDKGISLSIVSLGMIEKSRAGDMLLFKTQLFQSSAAIAGVLLFVYISRQFIIKNFRINALISISFFLFISGLAWAATFAIFSVVGQSFPAPIKSLSISLEYYLDNKSDKPRILATSTKPVKPARYKTIVWLIDESIGGQYLSVNGYSKDTTPYLNRIQSSNNPNFMNFGIVPSISNCSGASNLLLRIGLTTQKKGNFKENLKALPTIFQYAKRAGFETYLIDAQAAEGQMQNNLSASDLLSIDHFETISRKFVPNTRDNEVLKKLDSLLATEDDKYRFVVVVKWGAHWPYPLTYQDEVFKPATRESFTEMTEDNKELIFNAYYNSLRFSVDGFLSKLIDGKDLDNQLILYTSDHGQSLYQNKDPLTHCHENNVPMDEFKVPLMAFSKNIKGVLKKSTNSNSQEQLFPTTLELMGYPNSVVNTYGTSLTQAIEPTQRKVNIILTGRKLNYQ